MKVTNKKKQEARSQQQAASSRKPVAGSRKHFIRIKIFIYLKDCSHSDIKSTIPNTIKGILKTENNIIVGNYI